MSGMRGLQPWSGWSQNERRQNERRREQRTLLVVVDDVQPPALLVAWVIGLVIRHRPRQVDAVHVERRLLS